MGKHYTFQKTEDSLLVIQEQEVKYRSRKPKEALLDQAQRAYLELKAEYGTNYTVTSKTLQERMGCAESTFNDNFCAGVNGFLAISERIVVERFAEALDGAGNELTDALTIGLRALYKVSPRSKYNLYQNTEFDMNLRTRFAAEVFGMDYWGRVIKPLHPAIELYLAENTEKWDGVSEAVKEHIFKLFAASFRWAVQLLVQENLNSQGIMEQTNRLKDYIALLKKLLLNQAKTLLEDRYHFETEIMRIAERSRDQSRK